LSLRNDSDQFAALKMTGNIINGGYEECVLLIFNPSFQNIEKFNQRKFNIE